MEKWIQKLSGAVIASVLALTLSARASADLQPDDADPDQPLPQYEEEAPEGNDPDEFDVDSDDADGDEGPSPLRGTLPNEGDGDGGDEVDDTVLTSGTDVTDGNDPDNGNAGDAGKAGDAGTADPGTISLGDTEFIPGESGSIDLSDTTSDEYDLFGFDAGDPDDASDDCFYMVDYDGSGESLTSEGSDINIIAAGLNQLGSIIADGNVNLTGTGILLVDDIQLSEGCGFFLHPIEGMYTSGSVAVFLLTSPADTANGTNAVYTMINGEHVSGILDEEYTVPAGIDLVIPSGSSLILQSLIQETVAPHVDENGEFVPETQTVYTSQPNLEYGHEYDYSAANLNIPESSALIVEDGAEITLNCLGGLSGQWIAPKITVAGTLEGAGIISGGVIEFGEHAAVDAVFQGCELHNHAQDVVLDLSGHCPLISSGGSSISRIVLAEDAVVDCYVDYFYLSDRPIFLTDAILGDGAIVFQSGHYLVTNPDFVLDNSVTVSAWAVTIEDISGQFTSAAGSAVSVIVDPDNAIMPDPAAIPVLSANINIASHLRPSDSYSWAGSIPDNGHGFLRSDLITGGILSFADLAGAYWASFPDDSLNHFIEVYTISDGKLERHLIVKDENSSYTEGSVSADQIWLIRLVSLRATSDSTGGGSVMSTDTSMTGSGILGGSGAGSITGGAGSSIFTGTGITNNSDDNNDDDNNNDPSPIVNPQSGTQQNVVVTVTSNDDTSGQQTDSLEDLESVFTLSAAADGQIITDLNGSVTVRFSCPAPETNSMIFVVFRDSDGSLKVFRARYDRISGQLVFECDMLGNFAVVCVDYNGDLKSDKFYELLESFDSVKKLH